MENVDIDEPTSFLGHVFLGCIERACKPNETIIEQYTKMFESRISAGATEKLPGWQKPHAQTEAWSNDMEGLLKIALSDTVNWQTRKWSNFTKFQIPAWMILNSSKENPNLLDNFQKCAHTNGPWNACNWHELDDLMFCGQSTSLRDQSQNGLRHVTDAWQGFDFLDSLHKRFPATLSCGKHGMTLQTRFVPTLRFCWRPWWLKLKPLVESCALLEAEHLSQWIGCARNKLLSRTVLQSLRLLFWMPGLRMDGLLALNLWDVVIEALRSNKDNIQPTHTSFRKTEGTSTQAYWTPGNWCSFWFQNQDSN